MLAWLLGACTPSTPAAPMISEIDGMSQIHIPAGEFPMGTSDDEPFAGSDEKPQHTVYLDEFWIDRMEVTNAMYARCVEAGACTEPASDRLFEEQYANSAVMGVTWFQTEAYCAWAGRRLPTEVEWEKAARGTDGRRFPWGNDLPDLSKFPDMDREVGYFSFDVSSYGVLEMAAHAREWVADWYDPFYYANSPKNNPQGPESGAGKSRRGGSLGAPLDRRRLSNRSNAAPDIINDDMSFRCAVSP